MSDAQFAFCVVGEAEVDELYVEVLVQEEVLDLQVAMQYADAVQVVDGRYDLPHELARAYLGQVLARTYVVHQVAAFAQLGDQIVTSHTTKKHKIFKQNDETNAPEAKTAEPTCFLSP